MTSRPQLSEFVAEAREHLADICDQLLNLERATGSAGHERVERLLRATHSIKGGGGYFGCRNIERIAHGMEDILDSIQRGEIALTASAVDVLLAATDQLTVLLDDIAHSDEWDIAAIIHQLETLQKSSLPISEDTAEASLPHDVPSVATGNLAIAAGDRHPGSNQAAGEPRELEFDLGELERTAGLDAMQLTAHLALLGTILRGELIVPEFDMPGGLADVSVRWRVQVLTTLSEAECRHRLGSMAVTVPPPGRESAADTSVPRPGTAPQPAASVTPLGSGSTRARISAEQETLAGDRRGTIRIPVQLVDRLMTLAGELVLVRNQTRRYVESNQPLPGPVRQRLEAVTSELQEVVLQTRMQPVGRLFGKFPRLVRDLSRQFGKQIELTLVGSEVELDKTILDAISDPLMHLIRNACDHGIERPEDRIRAGKPAAGTIQLTARHLGDQISIEIRDDGGGIDREAVRSQALRQQLRTAAELDRLDDRELMSLILLPGFSTAKEVTDVSGRGVGMDVVKTNISQFGGSLEISSVPGQGTTFLLRLPLTLAIIPCLLVTASGQRYAIPQKEVEELVCVHPGQSHARIEWAADQELLRLRGRLLPLVRLPIVLRPAEPFSAERRVAEEPGSAGEMTAPVTCAVVRVGSRRFGLTVDSVLASEEIVVKPMHASLRRLAIYSGVTILGDGQVALILDCDGISRHAAIRFGEDAEVRVGGAARIATATHRVLLFRDGPDEQFAVPLSLLRRIVMVSPQQIQRIGLKQFMVIDGQPIRLLRLADGLNVSRGDNAQVAFAIIPRGVEGRVAFLVREVLDTVDVSLDLQQPAVVAPGVLGTALIREQVTLFLDLATVAGRFSDTETPASTKSDAPRRARILVVDDTQLFRELVKGYLSAAGYDVVTACHGQGALEALDREAFDLVVSDLEMPVMSGWELARAIRARTAAREKKLPLLALTSLSSDEDRCQALADGFDEFQVKIDRRALLADVARLLQSNPATHSPGVPSHV